MWFHPSEVLRWVYGMKFHVTSMNTTFKINVICKRVDSNHMRNIL